MRFEPLEDRLVPAVNAMLAAGIVEVTMDDFETDNAQLRLAAGDPSTLEVVGTDNAVVGSFAVGTVNAINVNVGAAATDTLTINNANGVVTFPITYTGAGATSVALVITGNPGTPVTTETYAPNPTLGSGVWTPTAFRAAIRS